MAAFFVCISLIILHVPPMEKCKLVRPTGMDLVEGIPCHVNSAKISVICGRFFCPQKSQNNADNYPSA
jgi:hypothetical protein